jgi:hypothetical protein
MSQNPTGKNAAFLAGKGEMAARIAAFGSVLI